LRHDERSPRADRRVPPGRDRTLSTAAAIDDPTTTGGDAAPVGPRPGEKSARALGGYLILAGVTHFLVPGVYRQIVPRWIGHEKGVVAWSGVAEILVGALVALPRTRRPGAWLALITFAVVYPANIQMAIDAGRPHDAMSWGAWLRLPLLFPLFAWAIRVATR
jgi:uncharacterized membrane protein